VGSVYAVYIGALERDLKAQPTYSLLNSHYYIQPPLTKTIMSLRTDRARITVLFTKKADVSQEDFERFWTVEHPKLFSSLDIVKSNIVRYEQQIAATTAQANIAQSGAAAAPFHAAAVFEAKDFDTLWAVFQSEEYRTKVGAESLKYAEKGGQMFASNYAVVIDQ